MLDLLDNLLRQVLVSGTGIPAGHVGFQPPNGEWRTVVNGNFVGGQPFLSLNVYLFDLRENRKLRSNERIRTVQNGIATEQPSPARVDCHYLISTWSPAAQAAGMLEPTLDEHALLYQVAAVLFRTGTINPARTYASGSPELNAWPDEFREDELPLTVLPVEGFHKLAEFWSGMGAGSVWKPAIYVIITLPVALLREISGRLVTTTLTSHLITGERDSAEVLSQIGGRVFGRVRRFAVGTANVVAVNGVKLTVDTAAAFAVGDRVTHDNSTWVQIAGIAANDLTLSAPLAGVAAGNVLRMADLLPDQTTVRLLDVADLSSGSDVLLRGDDAAVPGTAAVDDAVIARVDPASRVVGLSPIPARIHRFNLNVSAANAPGLIAPAVGAWVYLERLTGERVQEARSDERGRFIFTRLIPGQYRLRTGAPGLGPVTRVIDVPSPSGEYDLQL